MEIAARRLAAAFLAFVLVCGAWAEPVCAMGRLPALQEEHGVQPGEQEEGTAVDKGIWQPEGSEPEDGQEEAYYTVTFGYDGGMDDEGAQESSQKVAAGELLRPEDVKAPERLGYVFAGWADEAGELWETDLLIQEDAVFTAVWEPVTYWVCFKSEGSGEMQPQRFTYDVEQPLDPCAFSRTGYVFVGWQYGGEALADGASVKNLSSEQESRVTLEAIWQKQTYTIRFDANGGTGRMEPMVCTYGKQRQLSANKFKRAGYTFKGWNTRKDGKGDSFQNKQKVQSLSDTPGKEIVLYAMWDGNPYKVKYNGNGATGGKMKSSSFTYGKEGRLRANAFRKKGYTFKGWSAKANGKGKKYQNKQRIKNLTTKHGASVSLYARWKLTKYTISYKLKGGKLKKAGKKTYTIKTKTYSLPIPVRKGYDFDGWYKDPKYKKRISQVKKGSTGNLKLYAKWVKCKRNPQAGSATITKCEAASTGKVSVKAVIPKRIASSDDCYYLAYVNPVNGRFHKVAKKAYKKGNISFTLKTSDNPGYAVSMFGIAVKKDGKYELISRPVFVGNVEKAAKNKKAYQLGRTKKGIQFADSVAELEAAGAKQTFLNVNYSQIRGSASVPYQYNGKTYYFDPLYAQQELVKECNKKKIIVTFQIMLDWTEGDTNLIPPEGRIRGAAPYYAWNVQDNAAREKMEAVFCYLGKLFGQKKCYVSNWILGNEISSARDWNYAGHMSESNYFRNYAYAYRAFYSAIRSQAANAHVFVCTDHYWNFAAPGGYSAKKSIESFVYHLNSIQSGLRWHLAFHPYSHPLPYTKVWEGYLIKDDESTESVTMKNLHVLTDYIQRTYGTSVRIILSELGYSSTMGQANQAAALAYSYYIAACHPMVDAFIIRSYRDNQCEAAQGLLMGIEGKEAFQVFQHMDTPGTFQYTDRYLGVIGASSWHNVIPGFQKEKLSTMYRIP